MSFMFIIEIFIETDRFALHFVCSIFPGKQKRIVTDFAIQEFAQFRVMELRTSLKDWIR